MDHTAPFFAATPFLFTIKSVSDHATIMTATRTNGQASPFSQKPTYELGRLSGDRLMILQAEWTAGGTERQV